MTFADAVQNTMEAMPAPVLIIGAIICTIFVLGIYHSIFDVAYFGCQAMLFEGFICLCIGLFIWGIIVTLFAAHWKLILAVMVILAVIVEFAKSR